MKKINPEKLPKSILMLILSVLCLAGAILVFIYCM